MKSASRSSPGTQPEQWGDVLPDEVVEGPQLLLDVGCLTSRARTLEQAIDEQGQEVRGVAREERIRGRGKLRWQAAEGLEPRPASQPHLGKPRGRLHVSEPGEQRDERVEGRARPHTRAEATVPAHVEAAPLLGRRRERQQYPSIVVTHPQGWVEERGRKSTNPAAAKRATGKTSSGPIPRGGAWCCVVAMRRRNCSAPTRTCTSVRAAIYRSSPPSTDTSTARPRSGSSKAWKHSPRVS